MHVYTHNCVDTHIICSKFMPKLIQFNIFTTLKIDCAYDCLFISSKLYFTIFSINSNGKSLLKGT